MLVGCESAASENYVATVGTQSEPAPLTLQSSELVDRRARCPITGYGKARRAARAAFPHHAAGVDPKVVNPVHEVLSSEERQVGKVAQRSNRARVDGALLEVVPIKRRPGRGHTDERTKSPLLKLADLRVSRVTESLELSTHGRPEWVHASDPVGEIDVSYRGCHAVLLSYRSQ